MGVIGIDHALVFRWADEMAIDITPALVAKIGLLESTARKRINAVADK